MSTSGHFSSSSSKNHVHEPVSGTQIGVTDAGIHLFTGDTMCADVTLRGTSRRAGRVEHPGCYTGHHVSSAHMAS